jgi:hypothetical protein
MAMADTGHALRPGSGQTWRRAFLRELGRSGNVALAAEKSGVAESTPYRERGKNSAFAVSWDRALETAREGLARPQPSPQAGGESTAQVPRPPARVVEGGPLLRGDQIIRASSKGRPCIARVGPGRWSARSERAFLDELTASANVKAAARAAGVSPQAAYNRRLRWPAFAAQWQDALAEGYARIETLLIHAATCTLDPEPSPAEAREAPIMTVEQAMNLFKLHRASVQGGKPQRYGWRQKLPDIEEVRAEVLRKVAAMEKARAWG